VSLTASEVRAILTDPLAGKGFDRVRSRKLWLEQRDGFALGIVLVRDDRIEATVLNVDVGEIMYGVTPSGIDDLRYAPFMVRAFSPRRDTTLAEEVMQAADWLNEFESVDDILDLLASEPGSPLRVPGMPLPASWPLRIFTAAALAVTTANPRAAALAEKALEENSNWRDSTNAGRRQRLLTAMA
jgi:hypothetical protein